MDDNHDDHDRQTPSAVETILMAGTFVVISILASYYLHTHFWA